MEINADAEELANFVWNLRAEDWQKIDPMITGVSTVLLKLEKNYDKLPNFVVRRL